MKKIYLRLDEEMSKRFSEVKENLGLEHDTEVLRYLINKEWRERREESVLERVKMLRDLAEARGDTELVKAIDNALKEKRRRDQLFE